MTRINLLPWREARRAQQQRNFVSLLAAAVAVAAGAVFAVHLFVADLIDHQKSRNDYLRDEIVKLNDIEREINEMKESEERLVARLDVIQKLQSGRPGMVKVFDNLVRRLPEDVYLTSFKAQGPTLTLRGNARINNVVSDFMRELEQSPLFGEPKLGIVENKRIFEDVPASQFDLAVSRQDSKKDDGEGEVLQ